MIRKSGISRSGRIPLRADFTSAYQLKLIVSEMVAVKSGLGYVLWDAYYVGRMDIVLADMVSIGIMGFLSDRLIVFIESKVLVWRMLQSH